jgi:aspartate kinase
MLVVHKYGGTSVANLDRIKNIAIKIKKIKDKKLDMVIVVSAMSGETDTAKATAERSLPPRPKVVISPFLLTP